MKVDSPSTWHATVKIPSFSVVPDNTNADVCIIGGGLTGLLSAYLLAKSGKKVVLIEKGRIGSGATGRTTGFLTQAIDTDLTDLVKMIGEEKAREVVGSHKAAIDLVESIVRDEGMECEFIRCSNFLYAKNEHEHEFLVKEKSIADKLGASVEMHTDDLSFPHAGYLEYKDQAKFHPLKFLGALAQAAEQAGALIYEESSATGIQEGPLAVRCGNLRITADHVISATYSPFEEPRALYLKKAMYVSYVMELRVPTRSLREGMYEDQENPYHYFRVDPKEGHDRVIVGGEDHRADIKIRPTKNMKALEDFVRLTFKGIPYEIVRTWRGPILEPIDGLAFIGAAGRSNIQYAFGFSGSGMTYAPIAAMIFRDSVSGKTSAWHELYDTQRLPGALSLMLKGRDYAGEMLHGAVKNAFTYRMR